MTATKAKLPHGLLLGWQEPPSSGRRRDFPSPLWDDRQEGHLITIAPTGAGKGVSCIIPALLTWRGPAIVIDPKGENYAVTASRRRAMGQKVHVLDPFCVTDCLRPDSLNPFDMLEPLKAATVDDARVLANAMVQTGSFGRSNDPYWDNRACQLIADAVLYCAKGHPMPTVRDVREVVERYDEWATDHQHAIQSGSCHHGISQPFRPVGMASGRTRTSITSTAIDQLAFIGDGAVTTSLWRSTVDLKKIQRGEPMTIYMVLPPDKLITHGKLLRLWLSTVVAALSRRRQRPKIPTLMLVDEAAQLGEMKELVSAITLMRGYGMKVWTFFQDLSQLKATYPRSWEAILNNSSVHQYFGAATPMAANLLQDYLADTCPRPVHALKQNQLALYRPGHAGTIIRMPNYLTDAMFQGLYSPNPFHRANTRPPLIDEDFDHVLHDEENHDHGTVLPFPAKEDRNG